MQKHELYFATDGHDYLVKSTVPKLIMATIGACGYSVVFNDSGGYWDGKALTVESSWTLTIFADVSHELLCTLARSLAHAFNQESVLVASFDGDAQLVYR